MKEGNGRRTHKPPDDSDSFSRQIEHPELRARLINLARRKGIPEADCEDVASDIIAEAIRCQAAYDRQRGSLSTWTIGIGGNVIRTYIRRLNAQKRKPEGGIISVDAASDPDANPLELKDTRAETERSSSEQFEHLVDTAGLSEKERKAIAFHRGEEADDIDVKFSSSTARRAMEKIKQAHTDEEFGESPQAADASECAYGKIPAAERSAAVLFDQLRRTPWFLDAITQWRKSPEWKEVQTYLKNERVLKRFPLVILPEHWPKQLSRYRDAAHQRDPLLRRRFEAAIDIAVAFPEWPTVSYSQIQPSERRQRLDQFGWPFGSEPFWDIDERTFEFFVNAADEKPPPTLSLGALLKYLNQAPDTGSPAYSSMHLVRVDWRYPLKTIVESFKKWAASQQNLSPQKLTQSGRSRTTLLVGFACIRLTEDFDLTKEEAMSWLKERFGAPIPSTPERLERAVRATRNSLKDFLPSPAEIGI